MSSTTTTRQHGMNPIKLLSRLRSQAKCRRPYDQVRLSKEEAEALTKARAANNEHTWQVFPVGTRVLVLFNGVFYLTEVLKTKVYEEKVPVVNQATGAVSTVKKTTVLYGAAYFPKNATLSKDNRFKHDHIDVQFCPMDHFTAATDAAFSALANLPPQLSIFDMSQRMAEQAVLDAAEDRDDDDDGPVAQPAVVVAPQAPWLVDASVNTDPVRFASQVHET